LDTAPVLDDGSAETEGETTVEDTDVAEDEVGTETTVPEDETFETEGTEDGGETVIDFDDTGTMESDYGESTEPSDDVDWMDDLPEDTGEGFE
jgi:hypothetical protein